MGWVSMREALEKARGLGGGRSWGPSTQARIRSVLRDLYRVRIAEIGDLVATYWGGRGGAGHDILRALSRAGVLEKVPVVGACADGRRRRRGYAVQLAPAGMGLVVEAWGLPARRAAHNRVPAEAREAQVQVAALYLALIRGGCSPNGLMDSREAKVRWGWPDWEPVQLVVAPQAGEPGLAVAWMQACDPRGLQRLLARMLEHGRRGGQGAPGWSLLGIPRNGQVPVRGWDGRRVLGSVHLLAPAQVLEWAPRLAAGTAGWLPHLRAAMAPLGLQGEVAYVGPASPGPLVLRGEGVHAYLADLRGWDPPRIALIREWKPSAVLDEPAELWALVREPGQLATLAEDLAGAWLRVHLVAQAGGAIWHRPAGRRAAR